MWTSALHSKSFSLPYCWTRTHWRRLSRCALKWPLLLWRYVYFYYLGVLKKTDSVVWMDFSFLVPLWINARCSPHSVVTRASCLPHGSSQAPKRGCEHSWVESGEFIHLSYISPAQLNSCFRWHQFAIIEQEISQNSTVPEPSLLPTFKTRKCGAVRC